MIVNGMTAFLDLGKCGTSWTEHALKQIVNDGLPFWPNPSRGVRHKGVDIRKTPKEILLYTIIRNPYTYYVSHLTFSHKTNGPLWATVSKFAGYRIETVEQYVREMNVNRRPLPDLNHQNPENAAWKNTDPSIGMQTMQYILLSDPQFLLEKRRTRKEIEDWYDEHWWSAENMVALNNSTLEDHFYSMLEKHESKFILKPNWREILSNLKVTDSIAKNQKLDYKKFHTPESIRIIEETDDILIKRFNYGI